MRVGLGRTAPATLEWTTPKGAAMNKEDMILISVDDHVIEPPDTFEGRVPKKFAEDAPKVVDQDDGSQIWVYAGIARPQIGINAVAGRPKEEYGMEPSSYSDMRPGAYDIHERIKDMDAGGILGSMCFPSMARFCGQFFAEAKDKQLAKAVVEAYNDWHMEDWAGSYPGRMIPLAIPMMWDAQLSADEVRRVAKKGAKAVTFAENPALLGLPSLHSAYWDPFWAACNDEGVLVCMHIGSSSHTPVTAPDAPIDVTFVLSPINIVSAASDVLFSPILRKFSDIKVVLSEGGIGWVPYLLERMDYVYDRHHAWTGSDFGDRKPSEVFQERFLTCFVDDAFGIEVRHHLDLENTMWECDYPHSDSIWPNAPEILEGRLKGVDDETVNKITHLNAMEHFGLEPFKYMPREQCTVGALRTKAAGHDVSIVAKGKRSSGLKATGGQMHSLFKPKTGVA